MGLRGWFRRRFGRAENRTGMVRFYDVETRRLVHIPASELRPGAVQAQVEGIDGPVWLLAEQLRPGAVKHAPFEEGVRDYIRHIRESFVEHNDLSLDEWEEGFRRDAHPEQEIALWSHAANVYTAFARDEPSASRRGDLYRCIIACLTTGPDAVWHILQPEVLDREEAQRVVNRFFGRSAES